MAIIKWITLALLLVISPITQAKIGQDKYYHAGCSFVYGIVASTVTDNKNVAFAIAMAPGLAKEIIDSQQKGNKFSINDLVADAVGAYFGVQVGQLLIYPDHNSLQFKYNFK